MMDGSLLVLGVAGPELATAEAALFRKLQPAPGGFSLAGFGVVLVFWAVYGLLLGALYAWVSNLVGR